jgi:CheY-like chemotaxis protein
MGPLLRQTVGEAAELRFELGSQVPRMEADALQLGQLVMNLVINAVESIATPPGVITITTGVMDCDRDYLQEDWLVDLPDAGEYVYLEVTDNGCGMDDETLTRIYDPFFTTKFIGRGLGMSAVQGIVRGHKGTIKIVSEPGGGSSVKVLFPELAGIVQHGAVGPAHGTTEQRMVLIADDEDAVRSVGVRMLRRLGYRVITADDGQEAIEAYRQHPGIYCVILDLTMPVMDGETAFQMLKQLDPLAKVILSSGYRQEDIAAKFTGKGLAGFLQKPYDIAALKEVLTNLKAD